MISFEVLVGFLDVLLQVEIWMLCQSLLLRVTICSQKPLLEFFNKRLLIMRAASEIGIDKSIFMFCGDWEKSMLLQISHLCFSKALYRKRLQHRISDLRCCYGKSIGGKKNEHIEQWTHIHRICSSTSQILALKFNKLRFQGVEVQIVPGSHQGPQTRLSRGLSTWSREVKLITKFLGATTRQG